MNAATRYGPSVVENTEPFEIMGVPVCVQYFSADIGMAPPDAGPDSGWVILTGSLHSNLWARVYPYYETDYDEEDC